MVLIETFVFFDIETTGFPWKERNRTKIIEFCALAVRRSEILNLKLNSIPTLKKISFLLNPEPLIPHKDVLKLTGIKLSDCKTAATFKEMYEKIEYFFKSLPQPVCLIAHNGNIFDFPILKAELNDIKKELPKELLCLDSLGSFRKLHKDNLLHISLDKTVINVDENESLNDTVDSDIMTDDDSDEWSYLSPEELDEIEELCKSLSDVSTDDKSVENISTTEKNSKYVHKEKSEQCDRATKIYKSIDATTDKPICTTKIIDKCVDARKIDKSVKTTQTKKADISIHTTKTDKYTRPTKIIDESVGTIKIDKSLDTTKTDKDTPTKLLFNLSSIHERLTRKKTEDAHRAEVDCRMLLECVIATRDVFLPYADKNCKLFTEMKTLKRY